MSRGGYTLTLVLMCLEVGKFCNHLCLGELGGWRKLCSNSGSVQILLVGGSGLLWRESPTMVHIGTINNDNDYHQHNDLFVSTREKKSDMYLPTVQADSKLCICIILTSINRKYFLTF